MGKLENLFDSRYKEATFVFPPSLSIQIKYITIIRYFLFHVHLVKGFNGMFLDIYVYIEI